MAIRRWCPSTGNRPLGLCGVNWASPLAQGLQAWVTAQGKFPLADLVRGFNLTGTCKLRPVTSGGNGLSFDSLDDGAEAVIPAYLKLPNPVSIDVWLYALGTPTDNANYFGVNYDSAGGSPFTCYQLGAGGGGSAGVVVFNWNSAGAFTQLNSSAAVPTAGQLTHLCAVKTDAAATLYMNGVSIATRSTSVASANYSSTSVLIAGDASGFSRNSNMIFLDGRVWNRALADTDVAHLFNYGTRWDLYWVPSGRRYVFIGAAAGVPTVLSGIPDTIWQRDTLMSGMTPSCTPGPDILVG